jgi:putative phosphoribosyl transferase
MKREVGRAADHLALTVPAGRANLSADVFLPARWRGLVVFAPGSRSGRHSPRNRFAADELNGGGLGTAPIDLLTGEEEAVDAQTTELRSNIALLGKWLVAITGWISGQKRSANLTRGYFGVSRGAAAALLAAVERPMIVLAVVSRGGRPDVAGPALENVLAPALFIVGGEDHVVLKQNREAMAQLPSETTSKLEAVPGATHLFEEPGTLDQVARVARSRFHQYLNPV